MHLDVQAMFSNLASQTMWILLKLVIALVIYFVGRWVMRRIVRLLDLAFEKRKVDLSLRSFARNTVQAIFIIVLLMVIVQTLGVNVTSLIAIFSAATLAIGMALSGTAQNFAGGVMILLMKPYRVGDFISAQGQSGTVREIKLFSTVITTGDNRTIYIPNNMIATAIVDNYSTAPLRRVDWTVGISYGDDIEAIRAAILAQLATDARILKRTGRRGMDFGAGRQRGDADRTRMGEQRRLLERILRTQRKILYTTARKGSAFPFPTDGCACQTRITYGTERDSGHLGPTRTVQICGPIDAWRHRGVADRRSPHERLGERKSERADRNIDVHRRRRHSACRGIFKNLRPHGRQSGHRPQGYARKLKAAFAEVLPEYDRDRVHVSDIKKCFAWYNALVQAGFTKFELPTDEAETAEK